MAIESLDLEEDSHLSHSKFGQLSCAKTAESRRVEHSAISPKNGSASTKEESLSNHDSIFETNPFETQAINSAQSKLEAANSKTKT